MRNVNLIPCNKCGHLPAIIIPLCNELAGVSEIICACKAREGEIYYSSQGWNEANNSEANDVKQLQLNLA